MFKLRLFIRAFTPTLTLPLKGEGIEILAGLHFLPPVRGKVRMGVSRRIQREIFMLLHPPRYAAITAGSCRTSSGKPSAIFLP